MSVVRKLSLSRNLNLNINYISVRRGAQCNLPTRGYPGSLTCGGFSSLDMSFTFGLLLSFAPLGEESEVEYVALGRLPGGLTSGIKVNGIIDLLVYF